MSLSHASCSEGVTSRDMIRRLDHIAIAVPDLEAAIARFVEDLGIPLGGREDVVSQSTSTVFLPSWKKRTARFTYALVQSGSMCNTASKSAKANFVGLLPVAIIILFPFIV